MRATVRDGGSFNSKGYLSYYPTKYWFAVVILVLPGISSQLFVYLAKLWEGRKQRPAVAESFGFSFAAGLSAIGVTLLLASGLVRIVWASDAYMGNSLGVVRQVLVDPFGGSGPVCAPDLFAIRGVVSEPAILLTNRGVDDLSSRWLAVLADAWSDDNFGLTNRYMADPSPAEEFLRVTDSPGDASGGLRVSWYPGQGNALPPVWLAEVPSSCT